AHREQGSRTPAGGALLGVGAGTDRRTTAVPAATAPARCRRAPLPDQGRTQRPVLRDARDEEAARLGCPVPGRAVLAQCPRRALQLRLGHRYRLEVSPDPRADPLAARVVGPAVPGSGSQRAVALGVAVL